MSLTEAVFGAFSEVGKDIRETRKKTIEMVRARAYGATGVAGTDDSAAVQRAHTAAGPNRAVMMDSGDFGAATTANPYGPNYVEGLGLRIQVGTNAAPATRQEAVLRIEKILANNQSSGRVWDEGAAYFGTEKRGGDGLAVGLTGYVHHNGGTNDVVAVHGRARITTNGAGGRGWGIWGYAVSSNTVRAPWHAAEFNGANEGVDPLWDGVAQCVRICLSDLATEGNRMSTGLSIGPNTTGGNNGFYTGINIEALAVIPTSEAMGNGEAIRFQGPASGGNIGGIRGRGRLKYGIRFDEAVLGSGCAMYLAANQKAVVWEDVNSNNFISYNNSVISVGTFFNLANSARLRVNNVNVVGAQQPNIPTIVAGNTNNDTKNNVINAIISTLRAHGLITPGTLTTNA